MYYINTIPYSRKNIPYSNSNRGFILPFALGFLSAPLLLKPYYNYNYPCQYPYCYYR